MKVFGMGEPITPAAFRAACDKFICIEILSTEEVLAIPDRQKETTKKEKLRNKTAKNLMNLLTTSINDLADENGWAFLGDLGNLLLKKRPDFDARNYGYAKLLPLIKSLPGFEIDERDTGRKHVKLVYIRAK